MTETPTPDTQIRAELYVRTDSSALLGAKEMLRRAERLDANGVFSESTVAGHWQRHQAPKEDWSSEAMDTYETFSDWADRNGFSLEPGFQTRTRSFIGMDDTEDVVVFPMVSLALYEDDELAAVFPCSDEDGTYTVETAIEAFERGDEDWLTQFDTVTASGAGRRSTVDDATAD